MPKYVALILTLLMIAACSETKVTSSGAGGDADNTNKPATSVEGAVTEPGAELPEE